MEPCKNCGADLVEAYCAQCGQKRFSLTHLTVKHFLTGALKDLTHFDFKLFADLPQLLFRPGVLTRDFVEGRINQHIKPTTMFLWMNIFFFLAGYQAVFPQAGFLAANVYWGGLGPKILGKAAQKGISAGEFIPMFNEHLAHYEKYLFFFLVPAFAICLFVLYSYKRDNYFVKHLVYSVHFWSYFFVYFTIVPILLSLSNSAYRWAFGSVWYHSYDGLMFRTVMQLGVIPYTFFALRKVYFEKWWITVLKTVAVYYIVMRLRQWGIACTYYVAYLTM